MGAWSHGYTSSSQFYWKPDIKKMLGTLAKYEADVRSRKKGAKQALEDFKAKRIGIVQKTREVSIIMHDRHEVIAKYSLGCSHLL